MIAAIYTRKSTEPLAVPDEPMPRTLTRLSDPKLRQIAASPKTPPRRRAAAVRVLQARARAFGLPPVSQNGATE